MRQRGFIYILPVPVSPFYLDSIALVLLKPWAEFSSYFKSGFLETSFFFRGLSWRLSFFSPEKSFILVSAEVWWFLCCKCVFLGIRIDTNNSELDSSLRVQRVTPWLIAAVGSDITCPRCKGWIKSQWWMNHRLLLRKPLERRWKMLFSARGSKALLIAHSLAELMNETARSQLTHNQKPCLDLCLQWVWLRLPLGCSEEPRSVVRQNQAHVHIVE